MELLTEIKHAWEWTGINPVELVTENEFGNLIIKDDADNFWRLCHEDVYCKIVAESIAAYNELIKDEEFLDDWFMSSMVAEAEKKLGKLKPDFKYHLKVPGILDGEYGGKNIKIVKLIDMIRFSGELGKQIEDLPDGAKVEFKPI